MATEDVIENELAKKLNAIITRAKRAEAVSEYRRGRKEGEFESLVDSSANRIIRLSRDVLSLEHSEGIVAIKLNQKLNEAIKALVRILGGVKSE